MNIFTIRKPQVPADQETRAPANQKPKIQADHFRADGDAARDRRDWTDAARCYRQHLEIEQDDAAIWVQLGHALKELGRHLEAEGAYRRALDLKPEDADGYLQLGHVLKLQGRTREAADCYGKSLRLVPSSAAYRELVSIGGVDAANKIADDAAAQSSTLVLFEIDDLLGYLRAHKTLSGIQRVQVGIIGNVLSTGEDESAVYAFVRTRQDGGGLWRVLPADLQAIIFHVTGPGVQHRVLLELLDRAEQNAVPIRPAAGQTYVILGAFWGFNGDVTRYARLKQAGVILGIYIYDLIPITHPEYCDAHLVSDFSLSLGDGLTVFDFIMTISEYTAQEVLRMQRRDNLPPVPVKVVPLAHVIKDVDESAPDVWTSNIELLKNRPFVMSVSTIEGRKNHAYLVSAWKLMIQEGLDPPHLVFVGREGWRVNDFLDQLKSSNYLNGKVLMLHGLSDGELTTLYRHCLFTAFPSFVEGWGLPVGESLAHGCPCVASGTTSIPEVGGDLVDYIDPYNLREGVEVLRKMVFDGAYRQQRREQILSQLEIRRWDDVARDLVAAVHEFRENGSRPFVPALLNPGEVFMPGEFRLGQLTPINYASRPLRAILSNSWYPAEQFGAWMRGTQGELQFRTPLKAGTMITIYLRMCGAPWAVGQDLRLSASGTTDTFQCAPFPRSVAKGNITIPVSTNAAFIFHHAATVGDNGRVSIKITVAGASAIPPSESRSFYVGLQSLAYSPSDDAAMRMDVSEAFMFEAIGLKAGRILKDEVAKERTYRRRVHK